MKINVPNDLKTNRNNRDYILEMIDKGEYKTISYIVDTHNSNDKLMPLTQKLLLIFDRFP